MELGLGLLVLAQVEERAAELAMGHGVVSGHGQGMVEEGIIVAPEPGLPVGQQGAAGQEQHPGQGQAGPAQAAVRQPIRGAPGKAEEKPNKGR